MKFKADPRTIKTILEANRKYIIPRYQREYSWEREQLEEFWNDINQQIDFDNNRYKDYFIGSLVLVGDDEQGVEFHVVDGQQRLTTITILLSVLTQIGKELKNNSFANNCYRYIEGRDGDYNEFFKLISESPKPFFQKSIQYFELDKKEQPSSDEEKRLQEAFDYFYKLITAKKKDVTDFDSYLKNILNQIINCVVIFITVDNEKEAQTIFETLNAKGKDLSTLDLIKNKIFEELNKEHPNDDAKDSWRSIKNIISSRDDGVTLSVFFRHFWISRYSFTNENKIYKAFLDKIDPKDYEYFIKYLHSFSENYVKILSPLPSDWKTIEEKRIFESLESIKNFRVIQPRPIITTLLGLHQDKKLKLTDLINIINKIEAFHFIFSAISSSRASGLESLYSKYSRQLAIVSSKNQILALLKDLSKQLHDKLEDISYSTFEDKFINLKYSNGYTKDKKLIQYIFKTYELS